MKTLRPILATATLCTLVYGVSELLDYDRSNTDHLLSHISQALPTGASILIVDPVSHQFCCEKETHILRLMERTSQTAWRVTYKQHDKVSVTRSLLEPQLIRYCDLLHLQIHRDVKLSCHTWTILMTKEEDDEHDDYGDGDDEHDDHGKRVCLQSSSSSFNTILLLTQSPCISQWVDLLRTQSHTNLWYPRENATSLDQAVFGRLVQSWQQFGGVLIASYSQ